MSDTSTSWDPKASGMRSYEDYQKASRTPNQNLGKNDFLSLLAAQLQYQDPLEPMKDTDFIAQLAQFSSLEQMDSLNSTMSMYQSYGLAGKYVYAEAVIDGVNTPIEGVVDRVINDNGTAWVQVNGYLVKASAVKQVYDKDIFNNQVLDYAHLIDKYVKSVTVDAEGNKTTVTGKVTGIGIVNNTLTAHLEGGGKVTVGSIVDIRANDDFPPDPVTPDPEEGEGEGEGDETP